MRPDVASGVTSRGRTPTAADGDHQVDATDDGGVQRVPDLDLVGRDRDRRVDVEAGLGEQLADQRPDEGLILAVGGAVVDDDHEGATEVAGLQAHRCHAVILA